MKRVLFVGVMLILTILSGCRKADPLPPPMGTPQPTLEVTRARMGSESTATLLSSSTPFPTATRMPSLTPLPPGSGSCPAKKP